MDRRAALKTMSCTAAALALPRIATAATTSEEITAENAIANVPSYIITAMTQSLNNFSVKQIENQLTAADVQAVATAYGIYAGALTAGGFDAAVEELANDLSSDLCLGVVNPAYVERIMTYFSAIGVPNAILSNGELLNPSAEQVQGAAAYIRQYGMHGVNGTAQAALAQLISSLPQNSGSITPSGLIQAEGFPGLKLDVVSYPVGGRMEKVFKHTPYCYALAFATALSAALGLVVLAAIGGFALWLQC